MTEADIHKAVIRNLVQRGMPKVFWKPVVGWEDFYVVSNMGQVKRISESRSTFVGRLLKPLICKKGYHYVQLCRPGTRKTLKVSRLVLEAFDQSFSAGAHADHINGDLSDNSLANLRSVTNEQNAKNKGVYKSNPFGVKGVSFRRNRYCARISVDGRRIDLGTFRALADAVAAYEAAAVKYYGAFARSA